MKQKLLTIAFVASQIAVFAQTTQPIDDYCWIMGDGEFYINFNNSYSNIEYSFDKIEWTKAVPTSAKDFSSFTKVPTDQKIYLRGENGVSNSFWGTDWWGCIRTTTDAMYHKWYNTGVAMDSCFSSYNSFYSEGVSLSVGGNLLSLVFGDKFKEESASTVESTLSRIFSGNSLIYDASRLYVTPQEYGTNKGQFSSYGEQYGTFQWCHHLTKGPHIKYFSKDLFSNCENLKEIFYEGDGTESDVSWYNNTTSICVDQLVIHVKKGVNIINKPTKAIVVEETDNVSINGREWVDLNLPSGTLWATCNIGADSPEQYGTYYDWDKNPVKDSWDDIWYTPTKTERDELINNCTYSLETINGVKGAKYTGSNGQSVFFPFAGYYQWGSGPYKVGIDGLYWTTTSYSNTEHWILRASYAVHEDNSDYYWPLYYFSFPVRAVCNITPKCSIPTISYINGRLKFACETEDVVYHYDIASQNATNHEISGEGNDIELQNTYIVSVYASKDGYRDSETATMELKLTAINGDLNSDGIVDAADAVKLVNIIIGQ